MTRRGPPRGLVEAKTKPLIRANSNPVNKQICVPGVTCCSHDSSFWSVFWGAAALSSCCIGRASSLVDLRSLWPCLDLQQLHQPNGAGRSFDDGERQSCVEIFIIVIAWLFMAIFEVVCFPLKVLAWAARVSGTYACCTAMLAGVFELGQVILVTTDIVSDVLIAIQFYQEERMGFFWSVHASNRVQLRAHLCYHHRVCVFILFIAQVAFTTFFMLACKQSRVPGCFVRLPSCCVGFLPVANASSPHDNDLPLTPEPSRLRFATLVSSVFRRCCRVAG
jgi:hypothetical protein